MRLTTLLWAALTIVVGISLFLLKYQVQALEDRLHSTTAQIERDKSAIRVLQAEWTYLNDPGRLRRLSEQHLGFAAPTQTQIISVSQIPFKNGVIPAPEASASIPAPTPAVGAPMLREADAAPRLKVNFEAFRAWAGFSAGPAVAERPGFAAAFTARLHYLLPQAWAGTTMMQEPPR